MIFKTCTEPGARVDFDFDRLRHVAVAVVGDAHAGLRIERRRARRKVLHRRLRIGAGELRARGERRIVHRASAHERQARGRCAAGVGCFRRVVGDHLDRFGGDVERCGGDLTQRGVRALPALGGADAHHRAFDRARAVEFDGRGRLFGEPERIADVLDARRDADAAPQMRLRRWIGTAVVQTRLRFLHAALEHRQRADARRQRRLRRLQIAFAIDVAAANLDRIHVERVRKPRHHHLGGELRLRRTEAAERTGRRVVGIHHVAVGAHVFDCVGAAGEERRRL